MPASSRGSARSISQGISADSRAVKPGFLFAAVPGTKADGLAFLPQALAAGAVAVMAERAPPDPLPDGVAFVEVANVRRALALAAAKFFPRQPATIAAVTGTSGKTSVAAFTRQIWARARVTPAASIGTVGVVTPTREVYGSLTTPDPVELHRTLDGLAGEGVTHLALEASSHGLDQHRLDGVRIGIAGFTNLSRDHLDYHGTIEAYLAAKLILFERLVAPAAPRSSRPTTSSRAEVAARARRHGLRRDRGRAHRRAMSALVDCAIDGFSQHLTIAHAGKTHRVRLPLVGAFQVENALVAAGQAIAAGGDPAAVVRRARRAHRRQGPARARRAQGRRADLRRLRPQARCARQGARGAAPLCRPAARRRLRRRRRPRRRQAAADGRHRRREGRPRHRHRRQSAQRGSRRDPRRHPERRRRAPARSATAARRSAARSPSSSAATCC